MADVQISTNEGHVGLVSFFTGFNDLLEQLNCIPGKETGIRCFISSRFSIEAKVKQQKLTVS